MTSLTYTQHLSVFAWACLTMFWTGMLMIHPRDHALCYPKEWGLTILRFIRAGAQINLVCLVILIGVRLLDRGIDNVRPSLARWFSLKLFIAYAVFCLMWIVMGGSTLAQTFCRDFLIYRIGVITLMMQFISLGIVFAFFRVF